MDKIIISELEVDAQIGVTNEERLRPQKLLISVELERDLAHAGRTDMDAATTPYDVVATMIRKIIAERPRKLIEAVAYDIAEEVLAKRMAVAVTVEVKKFSVPRTKFVAVNIHREQ